MRPEQMKTEQARITVPLWTRWPEKIVRGCEVLVALPLIVGLVTGSRLGRPWGMFVGIGCGVVALAALRRFPRVCLTCAALAPLAAGLLGWNPIPLWSGACFLGLALTLRGMSAVLAGAVLALGNLGGAAAYSHAIAPTIDPSPSISAFAALSSVAIGSAIYGHRRYWFELEGRTRTAEENRQAAVDRGIAEERVRIARDLHDSVGHQIAVVSMHLGSAEAHLGRDTDATRADLQAARVAVKAVLSETQQILRVLRVGTERDELAPTPAHTRVPALVSSLESAGLAIEARFDHLERPLPATVSAAVYRIVQEGLTNAQRYGDGNVSLTVTVPDGEGVLAIEIVNAIAHSARPESSSGEGRGLVGMQERAASVGGHVLVHRDDTLFWVHAELPVGKEDA